MVKCKACHKEMKTAKGCNYPYIIFGKEIFKRLPRSPTASGRCGDCGAMPGGLHHIGCDNERCPRCGGQLISCSCNSKPSQIGTLAGLKSTIPGSVHKKRNPRARDLGW